jgi:hypothetical protein
MAQDTKKLLAERTKTHGEYADHAQTTQGILAVLMRGRNWSTLPAIMRESLHMFAHKIGRIVTGNPCVPDHWDDISGYAVLISQRLQPDGTGLGPEYVREDPVPDFYASLAERHGLSRSETKRRVLEALMGTPAKGPRSLVGEEFRIGRTQYRVEKDDGGDHVRVSLDGTPTTIMYTRGWVEGRLKYKCGSEEMGPGTPEDGGHHARQPEPDDRELGTVREDGRITCLDGPRNHGTVYIRRKQLPNATKHGWRVAAGMVGESEVLVAVTR